MAKNYKSRRNSSKRLGARKTTNRSKKQLIPSMVKIATEDSVATVGTEAFRLLFEEIDSPVFIIQDGKLVFINKNGWEKFGYTTDKTIGKKIEHLITKRIEKSSQDLAVNGYFKALSRKTLPPLTISVIAENGELVPVEPKTAIIEYNKKPALLVVARDLRQATLEHEKSIEELVTTTMLVHAVAENLKNQMQSVKNAAYYFAQQLKGTQEYHRGANQAYYRHYDTATKMLEIMDNAINRADRAVKVLLDYTDHSPLKRQPLDVKALLEDVIKINAPLKNIKIDVPNEDLPLIVADRQDVVCAFSNLIWFCTQFMPEGGILQISVAKKADLVEVFLNCCGTFVSEEDFDNVFKPFYLFKDIVLGMTLPICKRFVERNGGTIKISSAPAKGTVFTIGLPCIV